MQIIEAALEYASKGWYVFPLAPNSKVPDGAQAPQGHHNATIDPEKIKAWNWEGRNIGVRTGQCSSLVVLDIDEVEQFPYFEKLPETRVVGTPGDGLHFCFTFHEGIRNRTKFIPGSDIRGEGGYVAAPPSSINGRSYRLLNAFQPAPFPEFLLNLVKEKPRATEAERSGAEGATSLVGEGGRNAHLTKAAGRMQRGNILTLEALIALNERDCDPPLPDREVEIIFNSVSRYTPANPVVIEESEIDPGESLIVRPSELLDLTINYLEDKDTVKGQPTGIEGLDRMLGGGKRLGEVTCWHAEAKAGKNSVWHKQQHLWIQRGILMGYASRELTPETEVIPNILSIAFQENAWLAAMSPERVKRYREEIAKWSLYFAKGYGHFPLEDLTSWVRALSVLGVRYFWMDHVHYMLEDPEDHKAASKLVKEIKTLAKQENVHIDLIIQPNKLMDGQKLSLNSIKGGSAMGQAIDNLLIYERIKGTDSKNIAKLTLDVARSKLCKRGSIYLQYDEKTTDIIEVEPDKAEVIDLGPTYGRAGYNAGN